MVAQTLPVLEEWVLQPDPVYFGGGRTCVCCGRSIKNAYVLVRGRSGLHLGTRCMISTMSYISGGLRGEEPRDIPPLTLEVVRSDFPSRRLVLAGGSRG